MWEYIYFYPLTIAGAGANHGLDPSESPSPVVKHVHKASVAGIHGDTQCALKAEVGALGVGREMDAVSADIANGWPSLQAHQIRFEFHKGAADHTYMRIDGEPWKQPLPEDDDTVMVEISHLGQVNMLASQNCIAESVHDPSTPSSASTHQDDDDCGADDSDEELEERRKFGAADTFRLPDEDADIAHLT